jgi:hypothetical protein
MYQEFPDHLAGFYTYVGSMPLRLSAMEAPSVLLVHLRLTQVAGLQYRRRSVVGQSSSQFPVTTHQGFICPVSRPTIYDDGVEHINKLWDASATLGYQLTNKL